jgi:BRICHOS domain
LNEFFNQLRSDFDSPMKDIRSMESEIGSLDETTIHKKWFKEELEVKDDKEDSYADIKVPDFKDGRRGRFIHDYKNNQTTIVDEQANRCFIYPLDYETTMPPQSMVDIFTKMQNGQVKLSTENDNLSKYFTFQILFPRHNNFEQENARCSAKVGA